MSSFTLAPLRRITPSPIRRAYRVTKRTQRDLRSATRHIVTSRRPTTVEPFSTVEDLFAHSPRHRFTEAELIRRQGLRPADLVRLAGPGQGRGRHVRLEVVSSREWLGRWCVTLSMLIPGAVLLGALLGLAFWSL